MTTTLMLFVQPEVDLETDIPPMSSELNPGEFGGLCASFPNVRCGSHCHDANLQSGCCGAKSLTTVTVPTLPDVSAASLQIDAQLTLMLACCMIAGPKESFSGTQRAVDDVTVLEVTKCNCQAVADCVCLDAPPSDDAARSGRNRSAQVRRSRPVARVHATTCPQARDRRCREQ